MKHIAMSSSEAETEALGERLGRLLPDGAAVALRGEIGAGKTCFVRGLAKGLGIDPSEVASPTFTLVREHGGERRLYHMDLYRLGGADEAREAGLEEYFSEGGVVAVERPGPMEDELPKDTVEVFIDEGDGEDLRRIVIDMPEHIAERWSRG